jgi:hypothetical protein
MSSYADLAVYNRHGQLTALVEIKNKPSTSRAWAAQLRHNLLAHGGYDTADFFLLATPDWLYLWKNVSTAPPLAEPTYVINAQPLFTPYCVDAGLDGRAFSNHAFELVVIAWLSDLIRSDTPPEQHAKGQRWLVESGFLPAVHNGRLAYEVSV